MLCNPQISETPCTIVYKLFGLLVHYNLLYAVQRTNIFVFSLSRDRTPEQCPSVVSLLSESYNPHVRYGAAMALGIACAGTGLKVR